MPSILSYYKLNEDRGCLVQIVPSTCLADNENFFIIIIIVATTY